MSIYIFYHIYCCEYTKSIIIEQITKIIFSNLYDKVDNIYCFLTGSKEYTKHIFNILLLYGKKFCIKEVGINDKSYERFTIHKIKNYIKKNDKFLYIHSKGTTKPNFNGVKDWKTYMEYFLIAKHEICIKLLDDYDTVGVNYFIEPFRHYSGNFWWCNANYFLNLPDAIHLNIIEHDRTSYTENYIGLNNPKAYCFYNTNINHYEVRYPISKYIDKKII